MKSFPFKKIDAFTTGRSTGNPAGCIYLQALSDITPAEMQQIAGELKGFVSEVVFLFPLSDGYLLKYYSSECEVDFCGHGTIAAMYDVIRGNPELLRRESLTIRVKDEHLTVKNQIKQDDAIYITAPAPRHLDLKVSPPEIAESLGIPDSQMDPGVPVAHVNGGLNTLLVPIRHFSDCLTITPDQEGLRTFCLTHGIDIVLVFTRETAVPDADYRTRVFAPKFGYLEDPATGSGNSAFGYYLVKNQLWSGSRLIIEQGPDGTNPNMIQLQTAEINQQTRVLFGGSAITRISGEYHLAE